MSSEEQIFFLDAETDVSVETIKMHAEMLEEYRKTRIISSKTHDKTCVELAYGFFRLGETIEAIKVLSRPRKDFWVTLYDTARDDPQFSAKIVKLVSIMKKLGVIENESSPEINIGKVAQS